MTRWLLLSALPAANALVSPRPPFARTNALNGRGPVYGRIPTSLDANDALSVATFSTAADAAPLADAVSASPGLNLVASLLVGAAIYFGPDWSLASLGLETGVQPGRATALFVGRLADSNSTFVIAQDEGYSASAPLPVQLVTFSAFAAAGSAGYSGLLYVFDGAATFVFAAAACCALAGGVYEIGRPRQQTRDEADVTDLLESSFAAFAEKRLERASMTATVHKSEVVRAFRKSVGRYRTAEGSEIADVQIERCLRKWLGGPVSPAGFCKGLALSAEAPIF